MHVGQENYRIDLQVSDLIKQSKYFKSSRKLYRSAVDFTVNHEPVIDPYFLGLLLGGARLRSVPIGLSNPDNEILDYVKKIAETLGLSANVAGISGVNCSLVYLGVNKKRNNPVRTELRKLGLWGKLSHQKFIPEAYKLESRSTRSGVIAGLIDTDGTLSAGNSVRYCTTSPMLAMDTGFVSKSWFRLFDF